MPKLDIATLLAHEAFVRRITRALVRDEHEADDVVQATLLTAMESPPRTGGNLRGWLATIARNLARRRHRSRERETRRRARLRAPGATGSVAEEVQRRELEHIVMAAVLALDERYRCVVLHRYLDGMSPAQCAKRLGIPRATVKTRLKRALATVRARLDRRLGGRSAWVVLLAAGSGSAPAAAAGGMGVLVMGQFAKVGLLVAVLVTGVLVWSTVDSGSEERRAETVDLPPPEVDEPIAEEDLPEDHVVPPGDPVAGPEKRPSPKSRPPPSSTPPKTPVDAPPAPQADRIFGRFVDAAGKPVRGVQVFAYRGSKRVRMGSTDATGWFKLDGLSGDYRLVVLRANRSWGTFRHVVDLPGTHRAGGSDLRVDFHGIHGRVVDAKGKPVSRGMVLVRRTGEEQRLAAVDISRGGHFAFFGPEEGTYNLTYLTHISGSETMTVEGGEAVSARDTDVTLRLLTGDTIEGVVLDENGKPKPRVWVRTTVGTTLTGDTTDAEGRFRIEGLKPTETYALTTWIHGYVPEVRKHILPGTQGLEFRLDPGLTSRGRLLDAAGKPVAHASLRVRPLTGGGLPLYPKTDAEGRFELTGLPDKRIRITLKTGRRSGEWEIHAGESDIVLRLES